MRRFLEDQIDAMIHGARLQSLSPVGGSTVAFRDSLHPLSKEDTCVKLSSAKGANFQTFCARDIDRIGGG